MSRKSWLCRATAMRGALGVGAILTLLSAFHVEALQADVIHPVVVVSEIHYHPVEEPEFDSEGNPKLDLSEDVHEFVEVQNPGTVAVDLSGWRLAGAVDYTFPTNSVLAPGAFKVVARNPDRIVSVYGIAAGSVLGPWSGKLGNSGATVRVVDGSDTTVDSVTYRSSFPWTTAPDALGDPDRFTGLSSTNFQYKGVSLQRVSATWTSDDPANWLASPLTGPTPGAAQASTRPVPKPVVTARTHLPADGTGTVVRPNVAAVVSCTFSGTDGLASATLEWFVDDINSYAETRNRTAMTALGDGRFTATIPGQASRNVVRYRILADRGDGTELVSPRADDFPIAPVGTAGALESWHGYFVTPVRSSANAAVYDVLVSTTSLSRMASNISQSPNRVTAASATGVPRDYPYVAAGAPEWNGTVPGVFANDGELWDIHIRYHGSRYHRASSNLSYKLQFPGTHPFNGQTSWFETLHGAEFIEAQKLNRLVGLPASRMRSVDFYLNSAANSVKSEQGEYADEMLDEYHAIQKRLNPDADKEGNGELYKAVGNRDASQNNNEGPYTRADEAPMPANSAWNQLQRYDWTFSLQNHGWKGPKPLRDLIEGMWTARGDTPALHNFSSDATKLARTKAWFTNNWDVDSLLTSMALLEWMSIWDDAAQNHFFWRRANGKWSRLGWDYDGVMSTTTTGGGGPGGPGGGGGGGGLGGGSSQTIFGGEYGATTVFDGVNWWKDTFYKCFRDEYQRRLWELNNSVLDPVNLTALGFTRAATFASARKTYVNTQLSTYGSYTKPERPVNSFPANGGSVGIATNFVASAYSHASGVAHASTLWELRGQSGSYEEPVLRELSTNSLTTLAIPLRKLDLGQTYFWRVTYYDANGHPSVVGAETSFTYGTSASGDTVVLNEVLAWNRTAVANGSGHPDYVELRNTGTSEVSLNGYTLSDDPLVPGKYAFPSDAVIPASGYRVVWCDDEVEAPGLHTGFGLDSDGDAVYLFHGSVLVDFVEFGPQAPDVSVGRAGSGSDTWQANLPTAGVVNSTVTLGAPAALRFNEWMANPAYGDDWFELHNTSDAVVALAGLYLSDTPSNPRLTQVPALSFVAAGGLVRFHADGKASGGSHADFKLSSAGETLVLSATNGTTVLDTVTFGVQALDVAQGRLPDGSEDIVSFTGQTASPGEPNWVPSAVVVNEVLARGVAPLEDAIELRNSGTNTADIGGWWLSDDSRTVRKFRIPTGTVLAPGGLVVFHEADLLAGAVPFSLDARGGEVVLAEADAAGVPTGRGSRVHFGASAANQSFGRVTATGLGATSGGAEFALLESTTFGNDSAATVEQFRLGHGAENVDIHLSPVLFTEVHYHPQETVDGEDTNAEFVEVANVSDVAVDLGSSRIRGNAGLTFAAGTTLAAGEKILLVTFDPADTSALAAFRTRYSLDASVRVFGPIDGSLANSTYDLELSYPLTLDGQRSYVQLDKVEYRDLAPWDIRADGGGSSLQRLGVDVLGNSAASWTAASPNPGIHVLEAEPTLSVVAVAAGSLTLRISGTSAGAHVVESSTDLSTWESRETVTATTVPFEWTDTSVSGTAVRFYRVRWP